MRRSVCAAPAHIVLKLELRLSKSQRQLTNERIMQTARTAPESRWDSCRISGNVAYAQREAAHTAKKKNGSLAAALANRIGAYLRPGERTASRRAIGQRGEGGAQSISEWLSKTANNMSEHILSGNQLRQKTKRN